MTVNPISQFSPHKQFFIFTEVNICKACTNSSGLKKSGTYRVSKKTWTFFEIGIIPLFIKESFQNFVWL